MLVRESCIRLLAKQTASSSKCIRYALQTQVRNATNINGPARPSPLQSVTYGSKDAPLLQPTGRFTNTTRSNHPDTPEEARAREIAQENAEKGVNFHAPEKQTSKKKKKFTLPETNNQISLPIITFIDSTGQSHPQTPLSTALQSFSRQTHTLVLVDPTTATCRLFTNKEYKAHLDTLKTKFKQVRISAKELQITWNVGDNDLEYRLNRAIKHLQTGGRMNIIMGARKVKLVRTRVQRDELLARIREILSPYAVEWREMTGGFPNAELWFQGIASKGDKQEGTAIDMEDEEEEEEGEDNVPAEGESQENPTIEDEPNESMSWEEFQAQRAKFKGKQNRRAQRAEADKAFEKTTGTPDSDAISTTFWQEFATPTVKPVPSAAVSKETAETPHSRVSPKKGEAAKAAEKARLEELSGKVGTGKEDQETQHKLHSVAAQFSKLGGSKSLFGSKIGRKQGIESSLQRVDKFLEKEGDECTSSKETMAPLEGNNAGKS